MKNVLIAEGRHYFADTLEHMLRRVLADHPPRVSMRFARAVSVAEGLRLLSEDGPFDLVMVNLILPDGNGTEVVRESKVRGPNTPVAVLNANEDLFEAFAAGADEVIWTRASLNEIVASLLRLLGIRTSQVPSILSIPPPPARIGSLTPPAPVDAAVESSPVVY